MKLKFHFFNGKMSKTFTIYRKKKVSFGDISNNDTNVNYINLIFYYNKPIFSKFSKSLNKDKIYMNYTSFYIFNDKFIETFIVSDNNFDIEQILNDNYLDTDNIDLIDCYYKKGNIYYYTINLKKKINFIDNYQWYDKFDFYHVDPVKLEEDIYENVLNDEDSDHLYKLSNNHIYKKFETSKFDSKILVKNIYRSFIGNNILCHSNLETANEFSKSSKS